MLNSDEGHKIKRLLAIDGKTQRGNADRNCKGNPPEMGGLCTGAKGKLGNLLRDARLYFSEKEFLKKCVYKKTVEKARVEDGHSDEKHSNRCRRRDKHRI